MDTRTLKAELARPAYLWIALTLCLLVGTTAVVVLAFILPARQEMQSLQFEQQALIARYERASQLDALGGEVDYWASVVPEMAAKLHWYGSASDFSGAILDAATLANVQLDREINEVRTGETHSVYSKTLYFKARYAAIERFIDELGQLELLVVPGALSLAPADEGEDNLGVTLSLTGYSEAQP